MADKPEFVDLISDATHQNRRRILPPVIEPEGKRETSRLSHWPPEGWREWKAEMLTPWKLRHGSPSARKKT